MKKVASIMKYKDLEKAKAWLKRLPMNYPEYKLEGLLYGDYLLWTSEYGLEIIYT